MWWEAYNLISNKKGLIGVEIFICKLGMNFAVKSSSNNIGFFDGFFLTCQLILWMVRGSIY